MHRIIRFAQAFAALLLLSSANAADIAINSGGSATGTWIADTISTGSTTSTGSSIDTSLVVKPAPTVVYQNMRWASSFTYTVTGLTADAVYTVRLHFCELTKTAIGQRKFNVAINSTSVLTNFDVFALATGQYKAVAKQFTANTDGSGQIVIAFTTGSADSPMVSGIEIIAPPYLVNCGGSATGSWAVDGYFDTGNTSSTGASIDTSGVVNPAPQAVYQTLRWAPGPFTYKLAGLAPFAVHTVRLHFAEKTYSGPNYRKFNVAINGASVLTNFDVYAAAGAMYKAVVKEFTAAAGIDGEILIEFTQGLIENPMVSGIEIVPPVLIGSASSGADRHWLKDAYFSTPSSTSSTTAAIDNSKVTGCDPARDSVYQAARYYAGSFTYTIPGLRAGNAYGVRLHFCENYFTYIGARKFNVAINGTSVLTNFDIYQTAGGINKAIMQEFSATANGSGQVVIAFSQGTANNPQINGIEVFPIGPLSPPPAPAALSATAGNARIALVWPAASGAATYNVYRGTTSNGQSPTPIATGLTSASYVNTGLTNGTTYYYKVKAVGSLGTSGDSVEASAAPLAVAAIAEAAIDCGKTTSGVGLWGNDAYFTSSPVASKVSSTTNTITTTGVTNPAPMAVYQTLRYYDGATGGLTYTIPGLLAGDTYTVRLHFCENYFTYANARKFNVAINGTSVLSDFDIYATAGAVNTANVQAFSATANSTGRIAIAFTKGSANNPAINGIEIVHNATGASVWASGGSDNHGLQSGSDNWAVWRGQAVNLSLAYPTRNFGWSVFIDTTTAGHIAAHTDQADTLIVQCSPFPTNVGATYANLIAGNYDSYWQQFGTNLKAREDAGYAPVIVSVAWEANGGYMPWGCLPTYLDNGTTYLVEHYTSPTQYIDGFKRIVDQLRVTYPTVKIAWIMNGHATPAFAGSTAAALYPGDNYVDYIGVDYYDHYPAAKTQAEFDTEGNAPDGIWWFLNMARSHGKKFLVPEWGIAPGSSSNNAGGNRTTDGKRTGDNPDFATWMFGVFQNANATNQFRGETYFNDACGGGNVDSDIINDCNPLTRDRYLQLY